MDKDYIIQKIAEYFFNKWKEEKIKEGYHLPEVCPSFDFNEEDESENSKKDIVHCNKCLIELCDFQHLNDYLKKEYLQKAEILYNDFLKIGLKIKLE